MAMRLYAVGQRSETVRRANLSAIVRELHVSGARSRSELVARTGLTRSAIRGLIGEFVDAGLASEVRATPLGGPGRPSPVVRPNPESAVVLAIDIAVDSLAVALVGLGGEVLDLVRVQRPRGHSSVDEIVGKLAELSGDLRAGSGNDSLIGIGVAVVGVVRRTDGLVSTAPNLGWRDVPLGSRFAGALNSVAPISIANDADLGALAEVRRGVAVGVEDVLYVHGEVGVGGGLIVNGRPLTGTAGFGGEVGHIPVNPDGIACQCGSVGCWETEVGEEALLRLAGHPPGGGWNEVEAVLEEASAGSAVALGAFDALARWLGIGLAGLVNVLNPRLVVLGGLFGRAHPFLIGALEAELDRRTLPGPRALIRIVPARLGVDAPLLGAAELAFEPLLADPASRLRPRGVRAELASA
ncbi:MAG: ROK family protein [Chloroflexi bacterium]|nr:ROK family protein [Chloroflexota bacterium]